MTMTEMDAKFCRGKDGMKTFKRQKSEQYLTFIRRVMQWADTTGYSTIEWKPSYYHAEQAKVKRP